MEHDVVPKNPEPSPTQALTVQAPVPDLVIEDMPGCTPQGAGRPVMADQPKRAPHLPWAWLPIPFFLLAFSGLLIWRSTTPHESPYLLLGLNFVFTMLASLMTAYLAFRAFLINGKPGSMLLGCGLLIWGATAMLATLLVHLGPNTLVTIHNVGVLLAALCHLTAAVLRWRSEGTVDAAGLWLTTGIMATVGVTGLVSIAAVAGWMPVFFIPGSGGTPVRQVVLWMSIGMFALTAGLMGKEYRRSPSSFLYWYASGLALIAVGLFGVLMQSIPGSIIGWAGRTAQFMGGAYILAAAFAALRESHVWGLPLELLLRETQAQLKDRIERYELVLAGAGAALWDWDVPNRRIVFSPQWKALHGFPEDDDVDREEAWRENVHPDDRERVFAALQRHFEGQTAVFSEEYRIACRDGTVKWVFDRGLAKRDATGRVVRMAGSEIDITEAKQAEAALVESESKYRDLFANMAEEVHFWQVVRNASGRIETWRLVDANPPALKTWGRKTVDEIRDQTTDEIFGKGATEHYLPVVQKIMTEGVPHTFEDYFPHLDKYFRFTSVPLGDRFITTGADITDIKKSEDALREINEELNEYTYAVVHNLKAPFRAVHNYANFLMEDLGERLEGEPKQFLDGIQNALDQAHHQFRDLDALYRIRTYEAEFEDLDIRALLDEVASVHRTASDRQLLISDRWPVVRGERLLMSQILAELISNGFKYNRSETKTVEVGWQPAADDRIEIFVRDNGIGIDPQYHEHIFHIFKRLHTEEEYEGTGIGLAIVRRAVKKIGAQLSIESAAGQGSTFVIRLPSAFGE